MHTSLWRRYRWLKGALLALAAVLLYLFLAHQAAFRPRMFTWNPGRNGSSGYPVVTTLAYLPDGSLATGNDDARVRYWQGTKEARGLDLENMEQRGTFAVDIVVLRFAPELRRQLLEPWRLDTLSPNQK